MLVADFGLAHSGDGGPGSGTPAYMAPEQHAGRRGDARADQFAFCVSLWEALFGQRPFVGRTAAALSEAVQAGSVLAPPRGRAPRWVRRLLERGLRTDPDTRHPSMEALVTALGRDPRRTAARIGVLVLLFLSSIGAALALMKRETPCRPTGRELAGVWDGERQAAVRRAHGDRSPVRSDDRGRGGARSRRMVRAVARGAGRVLRRYAPARRAVARSPRSADALSR